MYVGSVWIIHMKNDRSSFTRLTVESSFAQLLKLSDLFLLQMIRWTSCLQSCAKHDSTVYAEKKKKIKGCLRRDTTRTPSMLIVVMCLSIIGQVLVGQTKATSLK